MISLVHPLYRSTYTICTKYRPDWDLAKVLEEGFIHFVTVEVRNGGEIQYTE